MANFEKGIKNSNRNLGWVFLLSATSCKEDVSQSLLVI
jgi:hypothetical protein